jgi:hypothetical protein
MVQIGGHTKCTTLFNVNFDGAKFHGVPDQRYVSQIMDSAVRQLRNSSRTWAFNPTGQ